MSEDLDEGPRRARDHLARAALEILEAARALLGTALHASGMHAVAPDSLAGEIDRSLDALIASMRRGLPLEVSPTLSAPLFRALEAEILRWETRSQSDPDARPVLRAFIGLREILWELGVRPPAEAGRPTPPSSPADRATAPCSAQPPAGARSTRRVQRFDIER